MLDLVFPVSCLVCGRDGTFLCAESQGQLARLEKQKCLVCQKPSPFGKTHPDCVSKNTVDGAIAALTYKNRDVHNVIEVFKYKFVSDLAKPLAQLIIQAIQRQNLQEYFHDFVIIPVPLHPRRLNWRGFNQSKLLASELALQLHLTVNYQLVNRIKFTKPQVKFNAEERKKNLENAFNLNSEIKNQKFLLVDDLVTSGATANELAKLLKKSKAAEVWMISAAHG